jgi:hypothetical protein
LAAALTAVGGFLVWLGVDVKDWPWVLAAVVAVVLMPALIKGLSGEVKLKAAAGAWPRLEKARPEIVQYFRRRSQPWLGFLVIPLILAAIVLAGLVSAVLGGVLLAVAAVAATIVLRQRQRFVRAVRRASA